MTSLGERRPVSLHPKIGGQWEDEPRTLSMHHHLLTNTGNSPGDDTMYSRILVTNSWCCRTTRITEVKVTFIFTNIYLWRGHEYDVWIVVTYATVGGSFLITVCFPPPLLFNASTVLLLIFCWSVIVLCGGERSSMLVDLSMCHSWRRLSRREGNIWFLAGEGGVGETDGARGENNEEIIIFFLTDRPDTCYKGTQTLAQH